MFGVPTVETPGFAQRPTAGCPPIRAILDVRGTGKIEQYCPIDKVVHID